MRSDLTDTDRRMLALLTDRPQRVGHLGSMLWPTRRKPQSYARSAGRVLARLRARGLAAWIVRSTSDFGWVRI